MRRDRAFDVVTAFEEELAEYTGAPYVVTTDSCTNAIYLALKWTATEPWTIEPVAADVDAIPIETRFVHIPKHTYVGVAQAARHANYNITFTDQKWTGSYRLDPTPIIDSAKRFYRNMYSEGSLICLSFQAGKILPIGRGGAILTDNAEAADWLRNARLDGRTPGADYQDNTYQSFGAHCYITPPDAARGLWLLTYADDGPDDTWESYPDLSQATWT